MEGGSSFFNLEWLGLFCLMGTLLFLSALFSSSETALFSLGKEDVKRLKGEDSRIARILADLVGSPKKLLITILMGNTAVNVAFYSTSFVLSQEILRSGAPNASFWAWSVGLFSLLAVIIVGEVIPKGVAVRIPEHISRVVAVPISVVERLLLPFRIPVTLILDGLGRFFVRGGEKEPYITTEELKVMLALSERYGVVEPQERTMIHAVLDFGRMRVKDAMVPRVDMTAFDISDPAEDFLELVRETIHKKIPVYEENRDNILGVVYAKDVFLNPDADIRGMIRTVPFVPETKTVESLLREFRREHQQMAIVADEYGGTAGLITLEDILEEVVGEIQDETEGYEEPIRKFGSNKYLVHGSISLMDWCETFGFELDPVADTIGGYVVSLLGHIPQRNDSATYKNVVFTVKEVRKRRITRLLVEFVKDKGQD
ncbi:MAG: HlyC/CorC family transporter [Planctomycetes bacterium]|nr:HlyC/CorC family transporter [Planctomycetota bacterium]